ncbi:MAG: hypothetical protein E6Q97_35660 [Desulfurellales bacterium]|nr:MAG: hypothetical protein E6Q97_35660 [Desulfurellales bacterium]
MSMLREYLVGFVASRTRTFGGGRGSRHNPIAEALKDTPLQFAAGVDVGEVVDLVLQGIKEAKRDQQQLGAELTKIG